MKNNFLIGLAIVVVILVLLIATGSKNDSAIDLDAQNQNTESGTIQIPNEGGFSGGHTPRGFQGQGTGIFVGDNLNPNFPNGDGLQAFLTFDIGVLQDSDFGEATLISNDLHIRGNPFADLGNIVVEEVQYDSFSSELWDAGSLGQVCVLKQGTLVETMSCDIRDVISNAVRMGQETLQLRLRFETMSDGDNSADLAMFYKTDSNTNDRGVFIIEVN